MGPSRRRSLTRHRSSQTRSTGEFGGERESPERKISQHLSHEILGRTVRSGLFCNALKLFRGAQEGTESTGGEVWYKIDVRAAMHRGSVWLERHWRDALCELRQTTGLIPRSCGRSLDKRDRTRFATGSPRRELSMLLPPIAASLWPKSACTRSKN